MSIQPPRYLVLFFMGNMISNGAAMVMDPRIHNADTAKVLVVCTGGTIAMKRAPDSHVYSPAPKGTLVEELRSMPIFNDRQYPGIHLSTYVCLVLPPTENSKRIVYTVNECDPLLDSSNMAMDEWEKLSKVIEKHYETFDGFVILMGTDTMAYAASALSFMMENLGKPIIITGAQIPMFEPRSDGRDNFLSALVIAGHYDIPEVCVYFNNKLLRGNRTTKIDPQGFYAFQSPNLAALAETGTSIDVNWNIVRQPSDTKFCTAKEMSRKVAILHLFPGITNKIVSAFLQPPVEGAVVLTFGAGNGPDNRKDILQTFKEASERGVLFVNVTQCIKGTVSVSYEVGKALYDAGILPGGDMTTEAAFTKICYILATEQNKDKRKQMMQSNLRGEISLPKNSNENELKTTNDAIKNCRYLNELQM